MKNKWKLTDWLRTKVHFDFSFANRKHKFLIEMATKKEKSNGYRSSRHLQIFVCTFRRRNGQRCTDDKTRWRIHTQKQNNKKAQYAHKTSIIRCVECSLTPYFIGKNCLLLVSASNRKCCERKSDRAHCTHSLVGRGARTRRKILVLGSASWLRPSENRECNHFVVLWMLKLLLSVRHRRMRTHTDPTMRDARENTA